MKINKLEKNKEDAVIDLDIELSDEENAFFIGFAFNVLMSQGLLRIDEKKQEATLVSQDEKPDTVIPSTGPVGVAPDLQ